MEEIKINVSLKVWVYAILAMGALITILLVINYNVRGTDKTLDTIPFFMIMMAATIIPNFISSRTRLVITDTSLIVKTKAEWVVRLSGVESFYVDKFNGRTFIGIRYKEDTWEAGKENLVDDRKWRLKADMQGYPYEIYVNWLSKTPKEICDLLNQRINSSKN